MRIDFTSYYYSISLTDEISLSSAIFLSKNILRRIRISPNIKVIILSVLGEISAGGLEELARLSVSMRENSRELILYFKTTNEIKDEIKKLNLGLALKLCENEVELNQYVKNDFKLSDRHNEIVSVFSDSIISSFLAAQEKSTLMRSKSPLLRFYLETSSNFVGFVAIYPPSLEAKYFDDEEPDSGFVFLESSDVWGDYLKLFVLDAKESLNAVNEVVYKLLPFYSHESVNATQSTFLLSSMFFRVKEEGAFSIRCFVNCR